MSPALARCKLWFAWPLYIVGWYLSVWALPLTGPPSLLLLVAGISLVLASWFLLHLYIRERDLTGRQRLLQLIYIFSCLLLVPGLAGQGLSSFNPLWLAPANLLLLSGAAGLGLGYLLRVMFLFWH